MPQQPDAGFAPNIEVDDSKKYILQLEGIDEAPSKFRDKRKDAMMLTHRFLMFDPDTGVAVIDENTGEMFELWKITNDLTYDNPNTGKIAPTREIANALVGHRLTDDEVREMLEEGWGESLVGKKGIADVEWSDSGDGQTRLKLLRLKPYKAAARQKQQRPVRALTDEEDEE